MSRGTDGVKSTGGVRGTGRLEVRAGTWAEAGAERTPRPTTAETQDDRMEWVRS